jgi:type 2 lantibiotic biosynthesis protein LanM
LDTIFPLDIASRASNLSERICIVEELNAQRVSASSGTTLNAFDLWKINTLSNKLAGQFLMESFRGEIPVKYTQENIATILTAHKLCELNLDLLADHEQHLYADIHKTWLPTYQRALEDFDPAAEQPHTEVWRKPEIYYGKSAKVCEPFLALLQRELQTVCAQANAALELDLFDSHLIEDMQDHLLDRFALSLAWAIETDANVYCVRNGIDKSQTVEDDYINYLDATFLDNESYHQFYLKFPTLGRWLAQVTRFICDNGRMCIERLCDDVQEISDTFFQKKIIKIRAIKPGKSDYHAAGQSVALVEVDLLDAAQESFIYKPRCLQSEVGLQGILARLTRDGVLSFATYPIIAKQDYGYTALIPPGRNHVQSTEEVERIYEELGGYLGLFYILGGSDLHFENLLVADGHAFICDGETALGVPPSKADQPLDTVLDSVYKTGLLEWPRMPSVDAATEMRISGYTGGGSYHIPGSQPRVNAPQLSFKTSIRHEEGIWIDAGAGNRIYLDDKLTHPEDFKDWIITGFNRIYDWFRLEPEEAINCITELFADASIRFVSWASQVYMQLLIAARHPKCLMEPLEADLILDSIDKYPRKWDRDKIMATCELASLWQLDIPIFTMQAQHHELLNDHHRVLPITLQLTPLTYAAQRIRHLSQENQLQQQQYITASLSASEVQSPAFVTSAVDYARQIGWQLCALLRAPSEQAPWQSYQVSAAGVKPIAIETDLYNGTAGIAFFLAYLDAISPQQEFRQAAERALAYSITYCDKTQVGTFRGLSGIVYLLTHLYHLWQQPELLALAIKLSHEISTHIAEDRDFDILSGAAGIIPVMIGLSKLTSGDELAYAHRCAQHLLQYSERQGDSLSWSSSDPSRSKANLTGFVHGASGIGWALISLGCATDRPDYITAGQQAFAYEALHFDDQEQDWYDLRTNGVAANKNGLHFANGWCTGAAGIGLSRITAWAMLGKQDKALLSEASLALAATLRNFHHLGNDTLCHGRAGNAEFFLRFAQLKNEPAFQIEANVQAQSQWRNFEKARSWILGKVSIDVFPGLMVGLAGLGLHFLRLAHPEQIPSPLLLDAPHKR